MLEVCVVILIKNKETDMENGSEKLGTTIFNKRAGSNEIQLKKHLSYLSQRFSHIFSIYIYI